MKYPYGGVGVRLLESSLILRGVSSVMRLVCVAGSSLRSVRSKLADVSNNLQFNLRASIAEIGTVFYGTG